MPKAGPSMGSPRYDRVPPEGLDSPAIQRSKVDLPDPERPSRPTISPSLMVRFTPSSTTCCPSPSGLGKALLTSLTCNRGAVFMGVLSSEPVASLRVIVQGSPEEAVDDHDEQAHGH